MTKGESMKNTSGLYYPYIHMRDVEWLKRNLLLFPQICRMIPLGVAPADSDAVEDFKRTEGPFGPLLERIDPSSGRSRAAMQRLTQQFNVRIESDKAELVRRFGADAAAALRTATNPYGFQIQTLKAMELADLLLGSDLAWNPVRQEPHYPIGYIEVHPHVGEAIMTTMAVACAQDFGLEILTDNKELHHCLAEKELESVFETWIDRQGVHADPVKPQPECKLAVAVLECLDVSKLTPAGIVALHNEWECRQKFLKRLQELVDQLPEMMNEAKQQQRVQQLAQVAIDEWQHEKRKLSRIVQAMFPDFSKDAVKGAGQSLAQWIIGPAAVAASAVTAGTQAPIWQTVAAGVLVAFVAEGVRAVGKPSTSGPYRYLTKAEHAGVRLIVGR